MSARRGSAVGDSWKKLEGVEEARVFGMATFYSFSFY